MRSKVVLTYVALVTVVVGLVLAACAAPAPAPTSPTPAPSGPIELKVANYFPPPSGQSKITEEFIKDIERRTNGRVKITYYPGGTLLKAPAMADGIAKGIADIGYAHVEYSPGRFPVSEVVDVVPGYPSAWVGSHVANEFHDKFKPKEWDKYHVLLFNTSAPGLIISAKPVRKLEDLKGLTIRAPGRVGDLLEALGGIPRPTPMMEVYDAIAKKVIDGVFTPFETIKTFRFGEVVDYTTVSWQVGSVYNFYLAMNKESWNKLPQDIKDIFNVVSGEYRERYALMWNEIEFPGKEFGEKHGVEYIELSPEEAARWKEAAAPVVDNYVKEMVGKGYSEAEVRGWVKFIRERIDYWTEKQIEWGIESPTGPPEMRP